MSQGRGGKISKAGEVAKWPDGEVLSVQFTLGLPSKLVVKTGAS